MVLQKGMPVPVWGTADPGATVTVAFHGQVKTAVANTDGKWLVRLSPMAASAEPAELMVSSVTVPQGSVPDTLKLVDVLIGEIWVCSGQSNMELPLCETRNAFDEIADAHISPTSDSSLYPSAPLIHQYQIFRTANGVPVPRNPHPSSLPSAISLAVNCIASRRSGWPHQRLLGRHCGGGLDESRWFVG